MRQALFAAVPAFLLACSSGSNSALPQPSAVDSTGSAVGQGSVPTSIAPLSRFIAAVPAVTGRGKCLRRNEPDSERQFRLLVMFDSHNGSRTMSVLTIDSAGEVVGLGETRGVPTRDRDAPQPSPTSSTHVEVDVLSQRATVINRFPDGRQETGAGTVEELEHSGIIQDVQERIEFLQRSCIAE